MFAGSRPARPTTCSRHGSATAGHGDDPLFRLYVAMFLVDLMSEHGQRFNGNERASERRVRDGLMQALTRLLPITTL
jgi:hypothetical protein